ncbi:MAG: NAD(P)-dependent oxidoreductase [Planctomycetota bacterium]
MLVTGSSGAVGRVVIEALRRAGHTVDGLDRRPHGALPRETLGDIAEADTWERAFARKVGEPPIDTLVHLAAYPFRDGQFLEDLLGPNVVGMYRAFASAAAHGVGRVIFASTVQTVSGYAGDRPTPTDVHGPTNFYAATKCFAEDVGRVFALEQIESVIAARLGWFLRTPEEAENLRGREHLHGLYVSHADLARFFLAAVDAEHRGFAAYWCMSAGAPAASPEAPLPPSPYDLAPGRAELGYEPQDRFPHGLDWSFLPPVDRAARSDAEVNA